MKNNTRLLTARLVRSLTGLITILYLSMATAQAQPDDNGGEPASSDVPLDGGIAWLAAGGAAYGYRKLRQKKQTARNLSGYSTRQAE